jgi:hypothetical protein
MFYIFQCGVWKIPAIFRIKKEWQKTCMNKGNSIY